MKITNRIMNAIDARSTMKNSMIPAIIDSIPVAKLSVELSRPSLTLMNVAPNIISVTPNTKRPNDKRRILTCGTPPISTMTEMGNCVINPGA